MSAVTITSTTDLKSLFRNVLHGTVVRVTQRDATPGVGFHTLFPQYAIVTVHESREMEMLRTLNPVITLEQCLGKELKRTHKTRGKDPLLHQSVLMVMQNLPGPEHYLIPYEPKESTYEAFRRLHWHVCATTPAERERLDSRVAFDALAREAGVQTPPSATEPHCTKEKVRAFFEAHGPSVVQEFGETGGMGTTVLKSGEELNSLPADVFYGPRRLTVFIRGIDCACSGCIVDNTLIVSWTRAMIVGCPGVATQPVHYCGNDWNVEIPKEGVMALQKATEHIGKVLLRRGYRGIFGVDAIWDDEWGEAFVLEINPRILGATQLHSLLQMEHNLPPFLGLHLLSFLKEGVRIDQRAVQAIRDTPLHGAQLILRNILGKTVEVRGTVEPGIYCFERGALSFLRASVLFTDVREDEYLVTMVPAQGRDIAPDAQLIRIQTREQCYDAEKKELLPHMHLFVENLRHKLQLIPV